MQSADEIRTLYLDYFQSKGHMLVPSSSLIPATDPTLLLTTAGMVQMVPYFLGRAAPPARRMTSSQKCFRTTDLDSVGDYKHLTFFEMLGNFSVGDYFKRDAIAFAWELLTERLGLSKDRLYVTIHMDDDEAFRYWTEERHVPAERIYRYVSNWWGPPGAQGPCGPCSELHYDFGEQYGCAPMASPAAIAAWERDTALRQAQGERGGQAQGDPSASSGRAAAEQPGCHPNCDNCERFLEIWNLVFMQFFQDVDKKRTPLPAPNIDTGMGLERIVTVLQGKRTVYDTDIFQPLLHRVAELAGRTYGLTPNPSPLNVERGNVEEADHAIRVVAEHARGATFLIADGVVPSNEGRGYVLRRLIRRAVRYGRKLGLNEPFLGKVAELVVDRMGQAYPELRQTKDFVLRVLQIEEERFGETLELGQAMLEGYLTGVKSIEASADAVFSALAGNVSEAGLRNVARNFFVATAVAISGPHSEDEYIGYAMAGETLIPKSSLAENSTWRSPDQKLDRAALRERAVQASSRAQEAAKTLSGSVVFQLHDTYGFPPEVTEEIAKEHGLTVDMAGFEKEMEAQRARARASAQFGGARKNEVFDYAGLGVGGTTFVGYERLEHQSVVLALVVDGQAAQSAAEGQEVEVVLRETPFYAEKGGQLGDAGQIAGPFGRMEVADTQSPVSEVIVHRGRVAQGSIAVGETVRAAVDVERRMDTARNHTATHMLHAALRQVLGTHVRQAGSLVAAERLRFDFSHVQAVTRDELRRVEAMVNEKIRQDLPVGFHETTYTKAVQEGALAFFGETYGASVRVVEVGECGTGLTPNPSPLNVERGTVGGRGEGGHSRPSPLPEGEGTGAEACFSKEVCGGTHLTRTGQIGLCLVLGEQSVGAGMRRIEAVTGRHAEALARERLDTLEGLAQSLAATPADVPNRVAGLREEVERAKEHAASLERGLLRNEVEQALSQVGFETRPYDGVRAVALRLEHAASADALREAADWAKGKLGSAVVALGAVFNGQPTIFVSATPDLVKAGVHAGRIARELGAAMGGGGGGRPESAQAGGKDAAKLDEALRMLAKLVEGK